MGHHLTLSLEQWFSTVGGDLPFLVKNVDFNPTFRFLLFLRFICFEHVVLFGFFLVRTFVSFLEAVVY